MNTDVVGFNPAPIIAIVLIGVVCAITFKRTGSPKRTALAGVAVVAGLFAVALVAHLLGFE